MAQEIIILDRGWVIHGDAHRTLGEARGESMFTVYNASVVRRWGTTAGLGQLAEAKQPDTILDPLGTVTIEGGVLFRIPAKW